VERKKCDDNQFQQEWPEKKPEDTAWSFILRLRKERIRADALRSLTFRLCASEDQCEPFGSLSKTQMRDIEEPGGNFPGQRRVALFQDFQTRPGKSQEAGLFNSHDRGFVDLAG
jgi:hypothetical protein